MLTKPQLEKWVYGHFLKPRLSRHIKTNGGDIDAVYLARKMSVALRAEGFNIMLGVWARQLLFGLTRLPSNALKLPTDMSCIASPSIRPWSWIPIDHILSSRFGTLLTPTIRAMHCICGS